MLKNASPLNVEQVSDTADQPASGNASDLGGRLRQRRKALGLTLEAVAGRAGVTIGFVSQVERNLTSPSLSSLTALTDALDAHISDFFAPPPRPGETSRAEMRDIYASPGGGFDFERLSTVFPGSTLNGLLVHHPPGYVIDEMLHEGEEFYFVLKGTLTMIVEGTRTELGVGDSIHFASKRPHSVRNDTADTVTVLIINTMDVFGEDHGEEPANG